MQTPEVPAPRPAPLVANFTADELAFIKRRTGEFLAVVAANLRDTNLTPGDKEMWERYRTLCVSILTKLE